MPHVSLNGWSFRCLLLENFEVLQRELCEICGLDIDLVCIHGDFVVIVNLAMETRYIFWIVWIFLADFFSEVKHLFVTKANFFKFHFSKLPYPLRRKSTSIRVISNSIWHILLVLTYDLNSAYGKSCTIYQNCFAEQKMEVLLWVLVFLQKCKLDLINSIFITKLTRQYIINNGCLHPKEDKNLVQSFHVNNIFAIEWSISKIYTYI